jgi:hypothetical protein
MEGEHMKKGLFRKGCMMVGATLAMGAMVPAVASADSVSCPSQVQLSQPFQSFGDSNQYVLLSGQDPDKFDATGWNLKAGTKVVPAIVQNGTMGSVLDLTSKGQAISPVICVNASYPDFRTMVANLAGLQGVDVQVQMYQNGAWQIPLEMGMDKSGTGASFSASRASYLPGSSSPARATRPAPTRSTRCIASGSTRATRTEPSRRRRSTEPRAPCGGAGLALFRPCLPDSVRGRVGPWPSSRLASTASSTTPAALS